MADWLVRQPGSEPIGPVSTELVVRGLQAGRVAPSALVCRLGTQEWRLLTEFPEFAGFVFDDAETNVTDSPWFAHAPPSGPRPAPPPPPMRPQGLGLPAAPPTLGSRGLEPAPATRPLMAGQHAYDEVDDDAETRVAAPPSEAADFPVDDETMTKVAAGNVRPEPQRERGGVLPTLPMPAVPDFQATRADVPKPRPAAGAPAPASRPRAEDALPPTVPFVQAGAFPPPPGASHPGTPPSPYGYPPPPQYHPGPVAPPPWGQYPPPPHPESSGGDQGLKALVGLIVFLAVALAIVLILLLIRR